MGRLSQPAVLQHQNFMSPDPSIHGCSYSFCLSFLVIDTSCVRQWNTLQSFLLIFMPSCSEVRVQVGHKGSEKEIRTHRTTEEGGTKVKMKLTSRDLRMNEVHEISLQGSANPLGPGSKIMRKKSCILLPAAGKKRNFSSHFHKTWAPRLWISLSL